MAPDQEPADRDAAVRSMLVGRVTPPTKAVGPITRGHVRDALVTAAVLALVVALSVIAIRFGSDGHDRPAQGGLPATALPTASTAPGVLLGRFTSEGGPTQKHTIHPNGLALEVVFACAGVGDWSVHIPHDGDLAAFTPKGQEPGRCDGSSSSSGNKGHAGDATVSITSRPGMRWTLTVVGIPETYVTPRPIPTPTDSTGTAVPYCTADDLSARFVPRSMPKGVTEVDGGELELTNGSDTTCALAGYPEVRFLDAGHPLGTSTMNHIDERSSTKQGLRAVVLQPKGVAYSQIDWYLANYYPENEEGTCVARTVSAVQVDLAYDLSAPGQTGTLDVPIGRATACLNGAHGALGTYGQLSSTVFVDYSLGDEGR